MPQGTNRPHIIQITGYYPPSVGGVELRVKKLSRLLVDNGWDVSVMTSQNGLKPQTQRDGDITVRYLRSFIFASTPILPGLLRSLFSMRKHALMHVHVYHGFTPEVVCLASKLFKIPYIAHVRVEMAAEGRFGFLLPLYKRTLLRYSLRNASRVICLTDDYATMVRQKYGVDPAKIKVIPNATDFSLGDPKRIASKTQMLRIVCVGRLSKQKNISLLVDALKLYKSRFGNGFHLDIVGDGPLKQELIEQVRQADLVNQVTFHGFLHGDALEKIYADSDLFVLPTLYESFGSVYLEAMAKGLPIITSNIDAVRNVVINDRNGMLCAIEPKAFCDAIHRIASDPKQYASFSRSNLEDVARYQWGKIIDDTCRIYIDIAGEKK
ncbi:MAG TPA: glycosyltransferase family 4 protein [Candidatus Saccharimonadales bacterium]|nr:glycosyltransferase family 4 protein [Candidatus Saccharimonadales bacterium]